MLVLHIQRLIGLIANFVMHVEVPRTLVTAYTRT